MFRVVFHASLAAHNTVSTVSGIIETCAATCRERDWMGQVASTVSIMPDTVDTVLWAPDDGWNTTRNMLSNWQI